MHQYRGRRSCTEWGNRFPHPGSLLPVQLPEPEPTHRDEAKTWSDFGSAKGTGIGIASSTYGLAKREETERYRGEPNKEKPFLASCHGFPDWVSGSKPISGQRRKCNIISRGARQSSNVVWPRSPLSSLSPLSPLKSPPHLPHRLGQVLMLLGRSGPPNERVQLRGVWNALFNCNVVDLIFIRAPALSASQLSK